MIEKSFDLVAQPVEHLTFNQVAAGSNPAGVTESPLTSGLFLLGGGPQSKLIHHTCNLTPGLSDGDEEKDLALST